MKQILYAMMLSWSLTTQAFNGFYAGPAFSANTDEHTIGHVVRHTKHNHDQKKMGSVIGYGIQLRDDNFPLYLGIEVYIPLKNDVTSQDIPVLLQGKIQDVMHEISTLFPLEGSFMLGFPIDDNVMAYGKIGLSHKRIKHKVAALRHSATYTGTYPLYGGGLSFKVNGKWLIKTEFIAHGSQKKDNPVFTHEHHHHRVQVVMGYRF